MHQVPSLAQGRTPGGQFINIDCTVVNVTFLGRVCAEIFGTKCFSHFITCLDPKFASVLREAYALSPFPQGLLENVPYLKLNCSVTLSNCLTSLSLGFLICKMGSIIQLHRTGSCLPMAAGTQEAGNIQGDSVRVWLGSSSRS